MKGHKEAQNAQFNFNSSSLALCFLLMEFYGLLVQMNSKYSRACPEKPAEIVIFPSFAYLSAKMMKA